MLLDMNAFPQEHLRLLFHDPPIDVLKYVSLGMAPEVIDLLEHLPYQRDPKGHNVMSEYTISPEMLGVDFSAQGKLQLAYDPNDLGADELRRIGHYIEPRSTVISMAQYRESS